MSWYTVNVKQILPGDTINVRGEAWRVTSHQYLDGVIRFGVGAGPDEIVQYDLDESVERWKIEAAIR